MTKKVWTKSFSILIMKGAFKIKQISFSIIFKGLSLKQIKPPSLRCVKSVQIRSFFWSAFSRIWAEYCINLCIQSKCGKIRTRKNSVSGQFSRSVGRWECDFKDWDYMKNKIYIHSFIFCSPNYNFSEFLICLPSHPLTWLLTC